MTVVMREYTLLFVTLSRVTPYQLSGMLGSNLWRAAKASMYALRFSAVSYNRSMCCLEETSEGRKGG